MNSRAFLSSAPSCDARQALRSQVAPTVSRVVNRPGVGATKTAPSCALIVGIVLAAAPAARAENPAVCPEPDVFLDVRSLKIKELTLEVENLRARPGLWARLARMVDLGAGVEAFVDKVALRIKDLEIDGVLIVRMENAAQIFERAFDILELNPPMIEQMLGSIENSVDPGAVFAESIGKIVGSTIDPTGPEPRVLQKWERPDGKLQRVLEETGVISEKNYDAAGKLLAYRTVAHVIGLPIVREQALETGRLIRQVRDASGAVIEYAIERSGRLVSVAVVNAAPSPPTGEAPRPEEWQPSAEGPGRVKLRVVTEQGETVERTFAFAPSPAVQGGPGAVSAPAPRSKASAPAPPGPRGREATREERR